MGAEIESGMVTQGCSSICMSWEHTIPLPSPSGLISRVYAISNFGWWPSLD